MKNLIYRPPCDANGDFADWLNALRNLSGVYVTRLNEKRLDMLDVNYRPLAKPE